MTTLVTAAQIAELRRMVNESSGEGVYSDTLLTTYIEKYPHIDEQGEEPFTLSSAVPPVHVANSEWMPTYDLHAAAADIWEEKASAIAGIYDFSADGGNYSRSQQYEQYMKQARSHRSRRLPTSARVHKYPDESSGDDVVWIGNLPESD